VIIIAHHPPPKKSHKSITPKEAGPGIKSTEEGLIKTRPKVTLYFQIDRKAKIRIPELTSNLLSFKAFLQNQVSFL